MTYIQSNLTNLLSNVGNFTVEEVNSDCVLSRPSYITANNFAVFWTISAVCDKDTW